MADPADHPGQAVEPSPAPTVTRGPVRLSLGGTSADGKRLLLVDDQGAEFTLEVTPHLRATVRGDATRLGQLEIKMSSSIRPREIQTRVRAGETAEAVAEAAGTTVEAIMPYVGPVLAEREHLAQRALKASLRRTPGGGSAAPSRVLGDAVEGRLRRIEEDPEAVAWDSYRRETGRWVLTATYSTSQRSGVAKFTYDAPGNYALADNDDARWLVGETSEAEPAVRDDLQPVRERRLSAVPSDELPLGDSFDQALGLVTGEAAETLVDVPAADDEPIRSTTPEPAATADDEPESRSESAPQRRPVQKKRGRASVPSWDEIMFGGSDQA